MSNARASLMQDLGIAKMERPAGVAPRQFHEDFELVAIHYGLRAQGEYETAKAAARADLDNSIPTFAALADEIRSDRSAA
jgi:hypothetical protein